MTLVFEGDKFYSSQLYATESRVLEEAFNNISNCTSKAELWNILRGYNIDQPKPILDDLCRYHFLEEVLCLSFDVCIDKNKRHPRYKLKDSPLSVYSSLKSGRVKLSGIISLER